MNTDLLKKIQDENICGKCKGSGHTTGECSYSVKTKKEACRGNSCAVARDADCDFDGNIEYICPSCTGGFIVPGLNETKWVMDRGTEVKRADVVYQLKSGLPFLPSPTLEEVMDMLPKEITYEHSPCSLFMEWTDNKKYRFGYRYHYRRWIENLGRSDPSPLIASLKLLLWYIEMKREGKV